VVEIALEHSKNFKSIVCEPGLNPGKAFEKWIEEVLKESPNL